MAGGKQLLVSLVDPGELAICSVARLSLQDLQWCDGNVPMLAGIATRKRAYTKTSLVVEKGGRVIGKSPEVAGGANTKVVVVEYLQVSRARYYGLTGGNKGRHRGRGAYVALEQELEQLKAEAAAARQAREPVNMKGISKCTKRLRDRGWLPEPVLEVIDALKDCGMPRAMAYGARATLRAAARRVHLVLDDSSPWWRFKTSGVSRQLKFEADKRAHAGLDDILKFIAPQTPTVSTAVVIGNWQGRKGMRGSAGAAPIKRLRRHAARRITLIEADEAFTSRRCAACREITKDQEHRVGRVKQTLRRRAQRLRGFLKAYALKLGIDEGERVPPQVYKKLKRRAAYIRKPVHGTSWCVDCVACGPDTADEAEGEGEAEAEGEGEGKEEAADDGEGGGRPEDDPPYRVWSRDFSASRNIGYLFWHILNREGQRPSYLCAPPDPV